MLLRRLDHAAVKVRGICIGNDQIRVKEASILHHDAFNNALFNRQRLHGLPELQVDALPQHQIAQRLRNGSRPAHGEMHAMGSFQIMDQAINAGGVERVPTNQQRLY